MAAARFVNPEVAAALSRLPPFEPVNASNLAAYRAARLAELDSMVLSDDVVRTDIEVAGPPGAPAVSLRVHRPARGTPLRPCVYWMHGGGYVMGSARGDDVRFDRWCTRFDCVGIAVDYRLAPETPYPGALEDCFAGLRFVYDNADELGVDRSGLGIGGASAGGGLAAALALVARDRGGPPVAFQTLIYPMLDDRRVTPSSSWDVPIWKPAANSFGWASYLGSLAGDEIPAYAAPARAADLAGLAPSLVIVGTADGFLDEDIAYASRLNEAGVQVDLRVYAGAPHGFDFFTPDAAIARQARRDVTEWMQGHLNPPRPT